MSRGTIRQAFAALRADGIIASRRGARRVVIGGPRVQSFREELITDQGELAKMWILRKLLHPMDELAAIEFLLDKMKDTKSNGEFFEAMKR